MFKIISLLWPSFSTEMLGKIWISFTFLIFTPSLLYLLYRILEALITNIKNILYFSYQISGYSKSIYKMSTVCEYNLMCKI